MAWHDADRVQIRLAYLVQRVHVGVVDAVHVGAWCSANHASRQLADGCVRFDGTDIRSGLLESALTV